MKTGYKQKLFLYIVVVFALFTAGVIFLEQSRERQHKTEALEEKLDVFAGIVHAELEHRPEAQQSLDSLLSLFPENIRLTLIDRQGRVLYDNAIKEADQMENHARRPEIIAAREKGKGRDIRISSSNKTEYLYYAKQFNNYYIRVALPYDIRVKHFMEADNLFLYYIILLFAVMLALINLVAGRFGKSIRQLRDFTRFIENKERSKDNSPYSILHSSFPKDELGEIGAKIALNYRQLKESEKEIALEREKLLQHVHSSEEGLCFFSASQSVEFYNGLFIQYLNVIADNANSNPANIFIDRSFEKVVSFIFNREKRDNYFETPINKQGKNFMVRVNIFDDKSFEIIINDITKQEKTRRLKQEMTGNITHELRTPVTGIRGCLETILEYPMETEKKDYFIKSAYEQVLALSELIQDMSLITKMEEAPQSFKLKAVNICRLLSGLKEEFAAALQEKNMEMEWNVGENVMVKGNHNLIYSIFRNLTDNAVRYAGKGVRIYINRDSEDKDFYYFSYSDTGVGIPGEQHLNRLFERFYRVNEGRTRDTGGSGLGLSIVKNAVAFHKGKIVAKNRAGGGLEFLFKLPKMSAG
ncbi:MAG: two-component sensor histidine kinase [Dysgonamonadaceae bacterium]|jgi:signal transduction histidine kinase|nr:two-component sensor histidine kinase [Dysgonamonadaceae bacterium]